MGPVDEIELDDVVGPATMPGAPSPRRRRRPAVPWVAAATGLVLAGALAVPPGGVRIDDRDREVAIGVRDDLDLGGSPGVTWRVGLDLRLESYEILQVHDGVVVVGDATGLVGHELGDGSQRWAIDAVDPLCLEGRGLVCVDAPGTADAAVLRIDPGTGTVDRLPRPGTSVAVALADDALALLETDAGTSPGTLAQTPRLVLLEPDGSERWAVDTALVHDPTWGPLYADIRVQDGVVGVGDGAPGRDVTTGDPVGSGTTGWWYDDGVEIRYADGATVDADRPRFDVVVDGVVVAPDQELLLRPDDDLGGAVDLRMSDRDGESRVVASRTDTGAELWRSEPNRYPSVRLAGVVVMGPWEGSASLVGVDVWTGEQLWERSDDVVLLGSADRESGTLLGFEGRGTPVGVDVRTGETRWTVDVDGWYGTAVETPTGMVLLTEDGLVRLDWPR